MRSLFITLLALSTMGCTKTAPQPDLKGQDVRLTVIHTADLHSRIFPYQFAPGQIDKGLGLVPSHGNIAIVGGAARMATVIKQERAAAERVIHVDSGDIFEGAPVFNMFAGEAEMRAWTKIGVTAMALGNHEFDKGPVNLELMKTQFGGFPILAANYIFTDPDDPTQPKLKKLIMPFSIVNVAGLKVGMIGLGNLSSLVNIVEGNNPLGVRPIDATQAIRDTVRVVRPQVDLLVILSHMGLDEDEQAAQENMTAANADQNKAAAIDGVDVIFGGHLHIVLNPPKDLPRVDEQGNPAGHTILCHSGAFGKYVGRLDLVVHVAKGTPDDTKSFVKSYTYKLIPIDDTIPEDPDMANMLEPYQLKMNQTLNLTQNYAVVACGNDQSTCPKIVRNDPDGGDSQLGNLVAQSMRIRKRVEADYALTNSLGIRTDFESGPLNLEEMYNVFPFDNTIETLFLSGNETAEMLDFVASKSGMRGCKSQAQVAGIWFTMDCGHGVSCGPYDNTGARSMHCHQGAEWNRLAQGPCSGGDQATTDMECKGPGFMCSSGACTPVDGPPLLGDDCLNHPEGCQKMTPSGEYRVAVNDYIANGGSGFYMLKSNTTKFNTGISLRDALIDYIRELPTRCDTTMVPAPMGASNINYNARDYTEKLTACDVNASQDDLDTLCGTMYSPDDPNRQNGHVCQIDPDQPQSTQTFCLRHYDFSGLPCLDQTFLSHDGRIQPID